MFFYKEITHGHNAELPGLPIQYVDYAYWQTTHMDKEVLQKDLKYWKKQLAGVLPTLE
jgi:hypothetical protein